MAVAARRAVQEAARRYIEDMGFAVVPLAEHSKACRIDGWPDKTFGPADFSDAANIGIRSVAGLVVLDDDFPTSEVACADAFLSSTPAIFGRPRKPRSKRLYYCPELSECVTLVDIDGSHLLQLRVGLQDMCPPSVHPDTGETLEWDGVLGSPRTVSKDNLVAVARAYWAARLIGKYWPARNRHALRLAYARVLLDTLSLSPQFATHILEWACRVGGSDENGIRDAANAIESTRRQLADDQPATGARTVAMLLGEPGRKIVRLLRRAYGKSDPTDEAIEALNEHHAIVSVGNRVVVMETWPDGGIKQLWPFEEFKKRHTKVVVLVGGKRRPLADVWLTDPRGRSHDRLVFVMPGGAETHLPNDYNGYLGFTVHPAAGDWGKNQHHLRHIICRDDAKAFDWLFNWMAALVQRPGRHAFTAVVLRGGQGTGKGHFAHLMLGALFHRQQYLHILGGGMLTGRFNEHLSGKVLVFADESTWGGDPGAADKLKGMVTESTIPIERKFLPLVEEPSALHIVIASNNDWPISIALDDRRFMVLDVADSQRQNDAHFVPLRQELASGGLAAMLHDLLAHPIDEHALRHPPSTQGKRGVMAQSLKPIERWWFEKLHSGLLDPHGDADWPASIQKAALHEDYMQFLDKHRVDARNRRATETELGQFLRRHVPRLAEQRSLVEGQRERFWSLPPLEECRAAWLERCQWPKDYDWEGEVG